jgi:hypothetical protein
MAVGRSNRGEATSNPATPTANLTGLAVSVFVGFMLGPKVIIKSIGFGVAVLFNAVVVRMILVLAQTLRHRHPADRRGACILRYGAGLATAGCRDAGGRGAAVGH